MFYFLGIGGTYVTALIGDDANKFIPSSDFLPKIFKYHSWKYQGVYSEALNPSHPCSQPAKDGIFGMGSGLVLTAPELAVKIAMKSAACHDRFENVGFIRWLYRN
jgi:hypothetical protein